MALTVYTSEQETGDIRLTGREARCLRFVAEQTPDNRTIQAHFGLGLAYYLGRRGLLASDSRNWTITSKGREMLNGDVHGN